MLSTSAQLRADRLRHHMGHIHYIKNLLNCGALVKENRSKLFQSVLLTGTVSANRKKMFKVYHRSSVDRTNTSLQKSLKELSVDKHPKAPSVG